MSGERPPDPKTASFGFREVPEGEKSGLVGRIFSAVAPRYDLMNDLMSGGVHRLWKDAFVGWLAPRPGQRFLDVAGGTGDIAFRIAERVKGDAAITVCDINPEMLAEGRRRAGTRANAGAIQWICGDAERLPVPDASADAYTIAFGIRNVTHIDRALADAYRALAPGGRFMCLEFSRCDVPLLDAAYEFWSFKAIPEIGAAVAGDREAYQYLVESIRRFPDQQAFARMIGEAGFANVKVRNLMGGIAAMHSGWKI